MARYKGLQLKLSFLWTDAPCFNKYSTASMCPSREAKCNGVRPE